MIPSRRLAALPGPVRTPAVAAVLVAAPVLAGHLARGVLTPVWALRLGQAFAFGAAALGLNVVMGYTGQISLGHAAFFGVGAFAGGMVAGRAGLPFLVAVVTAAAVGAAIALVLGLVSLRISGLYLAISTLAFGVAMFEGVFKAQAITGGSAGVPAPRPQAGDFVFSFNADYLGVVVALLLVVWHLDRNVVRTKLGRAFHAIREDEAVAASLGVDVPRYKTGAFVLGGAMSGVAGAMYAPLFGQVQAENFPFTMSLLFVVVLVVGGLGSRVGTFVAASAFQLFPAVFEGVRALEHLQFLIGALLLLVTLVRHPGGLAQAALEARERREERRRRLVEDAAHDTPVMLSLPAPRAAGPPPLPDGPLLAVRDLTVRFGGLVAVDGASFEVPAGTVVGLIGPNGAGKTTCFNAISGLVRPQAGSVIFRGEDVTSLPPHERARRGMGRTFQLLGLARSLSVMENLLLAQHRLASYPAPEGLLYTPRVARTERELVEAAREAIAALGFERYADTPVRNLSHGQQRLVELAAALVTSPEVLLLDEPSGGMSPRAAESLAERLLEIRDRLGRTVLLIEHHIPLVMAVCDLVHVLHLGRVLVSGSTKEIVRHPAVVEAYLGGGAARPRRRTAGARR